MNQEERIYHQIDAINNLAAAQRQAATMAASQAAAREMGAMRARQEEQNELMAQLIFEQQIAGWTEVEKQEARNDRKLGLDPLEMHSLPPSQRHQLRGQRQLEIENEERLEEQARAESFAAWQREEAREKAKKRWVVGILAAFVIFLIIFTPELNRQEARRQAQEEARQAQEARQSVFENSREPPREGTRPTRLGRKARSL